MDTSAHQLLSAMIANNASDLYLTANTPPSFRIGNKIMHHGEKNLAPADIERMMREIVSDEIIEEFNSTLEHNTAISWQNSARFRVNLFRQRQCVGMVLRRIHTEIPSLESLHLPAIYGKLIMKKRGLILIVGPTGSGKSTSMASMLEYRNLYGDGHIVTIEDPIEFVLEHKNCIITQRDVGIDTHSFGIGLKNALRQSPDVIVIGEIRDKETMEHAIVFSETGHLCMATLHANNANQAIERIINFFPQEKHPQLLLNLSLNLRAILSQRRLPNTMSGHSVAIEILLNEGLIKNLIHEGRIKEIKDCIEKSRDQGMQSFDQHLADMVIADLITEDVALAEADNPSNLRLTLKQLHIGGGKRSESAPINSLGIINKQQF